MTKPSSTELFAVTRRNAEPESPARNVPAARSSTTNIFGYAQSQMSTTASWVSGKTVSNVRAGAIIVTSFTDQPTGRSIGHAAELSLGVMQTDNETRRAPADERHADRRSIGLVRRGIGFTTDEGKNDGCFRRVTMRRTESPPNDVAKRSRACPRPVNRQSGAKRLAIRNSG